MTDVFTVEKRSQIMAAVKGCNTSIELKVRKALHRLGYRFRLSNKHIPGNPDLTFRTARVAVFVNGCFWHGHSCKRGKRIPGANHEYWETKIKRNKERDTRVCKELEAAGWSVCTIWECQLNRGIEEVERALKKAYS